MPQVAQERRHAGAVDEAEVKEGRAMMLTQGQLLAVLERLEPWHWMATVWRKLSNGKIVRFVNWGWKAARR